MDGVLSRNYRPTEEGRGWVEGRRVLSFVYSENAKTDAMKITDIKPNPNNPRPARRIMVSETRLWQFLEEHPKQNAPWCEWQDAFGGWDSFNGFERKFLQLTDQRASAVNCRTECGLGCPRKVVEHAADDIAAVCPEQEEKPYSLNKRDVLVYTLNRSAFHKSICAGLGITRNENSLDGIPGVCRLGDYTPTAGFNFPVYLTFKNDPDELLESVRNISLLGQALYALIIPTRKQLTPRVEDLLGRSGSICIVLSEEFSIQSNGSLKALRSAPLRFVAIYARPKKDGGGWRVEEF